MTAPSEKQWRSKMMRMGLVFVPLGVLLMGIGASLGSGPGGLTGYVVGSVGIVIPVLGALFAKFSAFGPVPDRYRRRSSE